MRIVILGAAAATLLGSGLAFSLQVVRPPARPLEPPRLPIAAAAATESVATVEPTPFEFRQVRTVPIKEPEAERPSPPAAAPLGTARTDEIPPARHAGALEERPPAILEAKPPAAPAVPMTVAALPERQASDLTSAQEPKPGLASIKRPITPPHRAWKRSAAARKSRRARRAAEVAATELPTPQAVYDGRNEYQSPLGRLLGGAH